MQRRTLYLLGLFLSSFLSAPAQPPPEEKTVWPISGTADKPDLPLIAPFGPRGSGGSYDFHRGMDITGAIGTPIHAVRAGKVVQVDEWDDKNSTAGKYVSIQHAPAPDGARIGTSYLHMHRISVRVGQEVRCGEVIGEVGQTGRGNPVSHLHFEYHENSGGLQFTTAKDPNKILPYLKKNAYRLRARRTGEGVEVVVGQPREEIDIRSVALVPEKGAPVTMDFDARAQQTAEAKEFQGARVVPSNYVGGLWTFMCALLGAPPGRVRVIVENWKGDKLMSPFLEIGAGEADVPLVPFHPLYDRAKKELELADEAAAAGRYGDALRRYEAALRAVRSIPQIREAAEAGTAALQAKGKEALAAAERMAAEGRTAEAKAALEKIARDFRGLKAAQDAQQRSRALAAALTPPASPPPGPTPPGESSAPAPAPRDPRRTLALGENYLRGGLFLKAAECFREVLDFGTGEDEDLLRKAKSLLKETEAKLKDQ